MADCGVVVAIIVLGAGEEGRGPFLLGLDRQDEGRQSPLAGSGLVGRGRDGGSPTR